MLYNYIVRSSLNVQKVIVNGFCKLNIMIYFIWSYAFFHNKKYKEKFFWWVNSLWMWSDLFNIQETQPEFNHHFEASNSIYYFFSNHLFVNSSSYLRKFLETECAVCFNLEFGYVLCRLCYSILKLPCNYISDSDFRINNSENTTI